MTALAKGRNTPRREGGVLEAGVLTGVLCYGGAMAVLDAAGYLKPAVTATGLLAVGRFEAEVDNTAGASGAVNARVQAGEFKWANSAGGDEITDAEVGDACYIVDDQTVAKTDASGTRSRAGIVTGVDATGVWVLTGIAFGNGPASALLPANNLSDLGTPATARANLGVTEAMGTPDITVNAAVGDDITVNIQLNDSAGDPLAVRGMVSAYLSDDAAGDSIAATAPDTVAGGTDGVYIPLVAGKRFDLVSESDGDIDLVVTENGADTWYLIIVMPDGTLVASDAITFS